MKRLTEIESRPHNIGFAIWRVKCYYETFVQDSTSVILLNFCAKMPPHRKAVNRCMQYEEIDDFNRVLFFLLSCQMDNQSIYLFGKWTLEKSEIEQLNIYGINETIPIKSTFEFEKDSMVIIENIVNKKKWTLSFKMTVQDDTIGKDNFFPGYRIKKLSADSLILVSKYRKEWTELPKPNEFGENLTLFEPYELLLTKK